MTEIVITPEWISARVHRAIELLRELEDKEIQFRDPVRIKTIDEHVETLIERFRAERERANMGAIPLVAASEANQQLLDRFLALQVKISNALKEA